MALPRRGDDITSRKTNLGNMVFSTICKLPTIACVDDWMYLGEADVASQQGIHDDVVDKQHCICHWHHGLVQIPNRPCLAVHQGCNGICKIGKNFTGE